MNIDAVLEGTGNESKIGPYLIAVKIVDEDLVNYVVNYFGRDVRPLRLHRIQSSERT